MSKYDALWEYVQKKELTEYGYQVGKISMKEQSVIFSRQAPPQGE